MYSWLNRIFHAQMIGDQQVHWLTWTISISRPIQWPLFVLVQKEANVNRKLLLAEHFFKIRFALYFQPRNTK